MTYLDMSFCVPFHDMFGQLVDPQVCGTAVIAVRDDDEWWIDEIRIDGTALKPRYWHYSAIRQAIEEKHADKIAELIEEDALALLDEAAIQRGG